MAKRNSILHTSRQKSMIDSRSHSCNVENYATTSRWEMVYQQFNPNYVLNLHRLAVSEPCRNTINQKFCPTTVNCVCQELPLIIVVIIKGGEKKLWTTCSGVLLIDSDTLCIKSRVGSKHKKCYSATFSYTASSIMRPLLEAGAYYNQGRLERASKNGKK